MQRDESTRGLLAAAGAFVIWGLLPVYWKALKAVPTAEILCHRIVWSLVFTGMLILALRRGAEVREALATRRNIALLAASSLLIGVNWLLYIWAVNSGHVIECSLGYYINPLVNVLLGFLVFRDRLRSVQWLAVGLAAAGVAVQVATVGRLPWIALALAVTFGLYGLCRKVMGAGPLPGMFVETGALGLPAGVFLAVLWAGGEGALGHQGPATDALLAGCGVVTSVPLLMFAYGARRMKLATLGILQYIGPTGMFLLGVFVYDEPFDLRKLTTFLLIWAGVALYTAEGWLRLRNLPRPGATG